MAADNTSFDFWAFALPWIQNLVFFAAGIIVTVIVEKRRALRGDYELWVWENNNSLRKEAIGESSNHLQYVVNGVTVEDPYEVSITLWANGKKDMPASVFNGRDAYVDLGVPIVSVLKQSTSAADETSLEVIEEDGKLVMHPSVVRRGMAAEWKFLTDGKPIIRMMNAPMDTDFVSWRDTYRGPRRSKTVAKIIGFSMIALAVTGFASSLIFRASIPWDSGTTAMITGLTTSFLLCGGAAVVMFGTTALGVRLRTAKRAVQSRSFRLEKPEPAVIDD